MRICFFPAALIAAAVCGCASTKSTDTARTGTEQLLISNSVDHALDKVDFHPMAGRNVFLLDKYVDCVDKSYVISSVRHRLLGAGANIVDSADKADVILEPRAGAVGTDRVSTFFGIPEISLPGPVPLALPEVRIVSRDSQFGTAKLGLVAYDAKTKRILGDGGMSLARSDENNWFFMGMGPWKTGSVKKSITVANEPRPTPSTIPTQVAFSRSPNVGEIALRPKPSNPIVPVSGEKANPFPKP